MIPCARLTLLGWPKVQLGIESLQAFLRSAGALGVWVYIFLERILIPTGLHHFVYGPFIFGPAVVEGGLQVYWAEHLQAFSQSTEPLKTLFPEGGFALHGNSKVFGSVGIALALYFTAAPENRVKVAGLLIPATLTAMLVGITEPLEFTFLFISPLLFAVHAVLAATMATVMYICGVVGNFGGGLLDQFLPQNWIPMFHHHASMMFIQIGIGLCFTALYFVVFRTLILRLNLKTPAGKRAKSSSTARPITVRHEVKPRPPPRQRPGWVRPLASCRPSAAPTTLKASTTAPPDCASRWSIWRKRKVTTSLKRWAPTG